MCKVHMAVCKALKDMQEKDRFERYVVTESVDDEREVDIVSDHVVKCRLNPCQFCLAKVRYRGFIWDKMTKAQRETIVNEFRAKDVMPHLKKILEDYLAKIRNRR